MSEELKHYGIKGMKWGRRRYESKDGTLTKAGKARYDAGVDDKKNKLKKSKKDYADAVKSGKNQSKKLSNYKYANREYKNSKIQAKLNMQTKKSKRQENLEKKYQDQGYSKEQASINAYKRVRTEKALMVVGGLTLAAASAYAVKAYRDENVDKILKSDKLIRNISTDANRGVKDTFYASTNKLDSHKYAGMYGKQINTLKPNSKIYEQTIKLSKNTKIASPKTARKTLEDMIKNDDNIKKELINEIRNKRALGMLGNTPKSLPMLRKAEENLKKGIVDKHVYDAFNAGLVNHSPSRQKINDDFYNKLKKSGFNAIKDINDSKYSGYKSKNPLIIFDGENTAKSQSVREIGKSEIAKRANIGIGSIMAEEYAKLGVGVVGVMGINSAVNISNNRTSELESINKYKKSHPNTKMSDSEILKSLGR